MISGLRHSLTKPLRSLYGFTKHHQHNTSTSLQLQTTPSKPISNLYTSTDINKASFNHTIFTWSAQAHLNPIALTNSSGCYLYDADGKRYFDLISTLVCTNIGHGNKKVIEAIKNQAEELAFASPAMSTKIRGEIGALLSQKTPGLLNHFFFTLAGSDAVENAIKFAKFYTKRSKIITRYRSYHGATQGAISLTGDPRRWPNEPSMPGIVRVSDPFRYRSILCSPDCTDEEFSYKLLEELEEVIIFENPESIAAIFMEPITGTNGIIIPPGGYLSGVRRLCDKYGILMVCDEVMTGFGRTGKWFACEHWNVVPDILIMAKGLTSAYLPLGAVAVNPKIYNHFSDEVFCSGATYNSHPMGLAAAKAVISVMSEENLVENSEIMGYTLSALLNQMKEKHPCVGDVRSIGLFGGIEIVENRVTKVPFSKHSDPFAASHVTKSMIKYMRDNGVYGVIANSVMMIAPPLIVNEMELIDVFKVIDRALDIADRHTV